MRFSVLGYQKQLVSRGALPRATAAKVSEADRSTMNGNGEPAGQWKPCAACTQPLFVDPRGGHCCAQCKAPVHSHVICEDVSVCKERASSIFTSHPQLRLRTCPMDGRPSVKCASLSYPSCSTASSKSAIAVSTSLIGFVERPGKPLLRNFSGPRTPFWTRLDLRAAHLKDLDLLLIKPGLGSWPAQMVKG